MGNLGHLILYGAGWKHFFLKRVILKHIGQLGTAAHKSEGNNGRQDNCIGESLVGRHLVGGETFLGGNSLRSKNKIIGGYKLTPFKI